MEKAMEFKRFIETSLNTHGRVALVLHSFDKTYCTRFLVRKSLTNCSNQQRPLVTSFDSISGHYPPAHSNNTTSPLISLSSKHQPLISPWCTDFISKIKQQTGAEPYHGTSSHIKTPTEGSP